MTLSKALICQEGNLIKVALVKDGIPIFFDADVIDRPGVLDSIYLAKIIKKESFVYWCDLGLDRPGLLASEKDFPPLREGDKVLVQISREAFEDDAENALNHFQKPVKLTRNIILSHQGCLYFPLKKSFKQRTAFTSLSFSNQENQLKNIYQQIIEKAAQCNIGIVYSGPSVLERFLKDLIVTSLAVLVETPELMLKAQEICRMYRPDLLETLSVKRTDLFQDEGIEDFWQSCLDPIIQLKEGKVIIEATSCVISIDVNGPIGMATSVNEEAVIVISQQLMWRRLSGNIIIDFMATDIEEKKKLLQKIEYALISDRPSWKVYGWSELGWLELQRSKRRIPLHTVLKRYTNECH